MNRQDNLELGDPGPGTGEELTDPVTGEELTDPGTGEELADPGTGEELTTNSGTRGELTNPENETGEEQLTDRGTGEERTDPGTREELTDPGIEEELTDPGKCCSEVLVSSSGLGRDFQPSRLGRLRYI